MAFDLGNLLQQYLGGASGADNTRATEDFEQAAQSVPREHLAQGVTQALRSDQTPAFAQMVGQMFSQSNPNQRAGMLNQLLGALGGGVAGGGLAGILGNVLGGGRPDVGTTPVTPEQAAQLSPEQVQQIAEKAEQQNPGVVERMGDFYAEHPNVVKALGGAALAIALGHMAQGIQRR